MVPAAAALMHALALVLTLHLSADSWVGPDKLKHFFMSAFIESASYSALRAARVDHGAALTGASVTTVVLGVGKEIHDNGTPEGFSVRDLSWDLAGGAAAAAVLTHAR